MKKDVIIKEWIKFAEMDLETALILSKQYPIKSEVICYHSQQSAEKMLKSYLLFQNEKVTKTHDLEKLRKSSELFDDSFADIEDLCDNLNDYGVLPRYPFELEIFPEDVDEAIRNAKKIRVFIGEKLGLPSFTEDDNVADDVKKAIFAMLDANIPLATIRKATNLTTEQFNNVLYDYDEKNE